MKSIMIKSIIGGICKEYIENIYIDEEVEVIINSDIVISFDCLCEELEYLAFGYLYSFGITRDEIGDIVIGKNKVNLSINRDNSMLLKLLESSKIFPTCESFVLSKNKQVGEKIVVPFNDSRTKLNIEFVKNYFLDYKNTLFEALVICYSDPFRKSCMSIDVSCKSVIYKVFAKSLDLGYKGEIFICNFEINREILKILILLRTTFVIMPYKPMFSVVKYAQQYGITLIQSFSNGSVKVYTHSSRVC